MTVSEQVEAILGETVSALSRLQTNELEELATRLTLVAGRFEAGSVEARRRLELKLNLLQACLNGTAENLAVLERLRDRRVSA